MKKSKVIKMPGGRRKKKGLLRKKKEAEPLGEIHITVYPHGADPQVRISGAFFPYRMMMEAMQLATLEVSEMYLHKALTGYLNDYGQMLGKNGEILGDSNAHLLDQMTQQSEEEAEASEETEGPPQE